MRRLPLAAQPRPLHGHLTPGCTSTWRSRALHPAPPCSYPEVCFRLQEALPRQVTCYRMAHAEEGGADGTPAQPAREQPQPGYAAEATQDSRLQREEDAPAPAEAAHPAPAMPHPQGHIVFLYRLVEGVAPASYGLNVARMAQLPARVLQRAATVAAQVQAAAEARRHGAAALPEHDRRQDGQAALVQLATDCRRFLSSMLAGGQVDGEAGRRLQQRARELLSLPGAAGGSA